MIAENGLGVKLYKLGINDQFAHGASKEYLMRKFKIDAMGLIEKVEEIKEKKFNISEKEINTFTVQNSKEVPKETQLESL